MGIRFIFDDTMEYGHLPRIKGENYKLKDNKVVKTNCNCKRWIIYTNDCNKERKQSLESLGLGYVGLTDCPSICEEGVR